MAGHRVTKCAALRQATLQQDQASQATRHLTQPHRASERPGAHPADCRAQMLVDFDRAIAREDKAIRESNDPEVLVQTRHRGVACPMDSAGAPFNRAGRSPNATSSDLRSRSSPCHRLTRSCPTCSGWPTSPAGAGYGG